MKKREITTTIYTSSDGKDFTSEKACIHHEKQVKFYERMKLKHGSVFLVFNKRGNYHGIEVFSTRELAKLSLANIQQELVSDYIIVEKEIDIRFWREL